MKQRNTLLELWRFFFCMAVLGLHFFNQTEWDYFHAGYLGVEFFFLVSGYFIGSYYDKNQSGKSVGARPKSVFFYAASRFKRLYPFYAPALILMLSVKMFILLLSAQLITFKDCLFYIFTTIKKSIVARLKSVLSYAVSRFKRLYPFYALALILMLGVRMFILLLSAELITFKDCFFYILTAMKNCFAEFLTLQWTPLGNEVLISAGWFVPAVFWGGLFFVLLLALTGRFGGYILSPLISFLIYRYYFNLIGKIDVIAAHHSVLRGIAGIGFGVFLYFLCKNFRRLVANRSKGPLIPGFFCIFASLLFLGIFIYTNFGRRSKWDFLVIALYGIGLLFLMSGSLKLPEPVNKFFLFLGKLTYPIYIFQMPVIELLFGAGDFLLIAAVALMKTLTFANF